MKKYLAAFLAALMVLSVCIIPVGAQETENNDVNSVIALAKERSFDLKEEDFEQSAAELSDDELDAVTGGGGIGICSCVGAGGGGGEDYDNGKTYGCACVGYGQGGDGRASDFNCFCVICGGGSDVDSF